MSVSQHTINSFQFRAEMCVHTKFGLMNSCADVYSLFEHAKERGITAIAITDTNSVRAFPHAEFAAKKFGIKLIYGCELLMTDGEDPFRILAYVQTQNGLKNLYRLLSITLDRKEKTTTREEVEAHRDGKDLLAVEVYTETWNWLSERNCATLISTQIIEQYAMAISRWIQCEECITEYGFLAKHPTTGNAIPSPYVSMSQSFSKQANTLCFLLRLPL